MVLKDYAYSISFSASTCLVNSKERAKEILSYFFEKTTRV